MSLAGDFLPSFHVMLEEKKTKPTAVPGVTQSHNPRQFSSPPSRGSPPIYTLHSTLSPTSLFQFPLGNKFYLSWIFWNGFLIKYIPLRHRKTHLCLKRILILISAKPWPRHPLLPQEFTVKLTGEGYTSAGDTQFSFDSDNDGRCFIWLELEVSHTKMILKYSSMVVIFKLQLNNGGSGEVETHTTKWCHISRA